MNQQQHQYFIFIEIDMLKGLSEAKDSDFVTAVFVKAPFTHHKAYLLNKKGLN